MTIKSILDNLKYDVSSGRENDIHLTERSFLLDMLDVNAASLYKGDKEPRPFKVRFSVEGIQKSRFPLTSFLIACCKWVVSAIIWFFYYSARSIRRIFAGDDKDLSTSPRFNFVVFVSVITFYIVALIAIIVFFLKSVLLFKPNSGMNEQGAIMIPQSCGREHYMYLFNTADCWANTGIKVLEGDEIIVTASGSFYSDIDNLYKCAKSNAQPAFSRSLIGSNRRNDISSKLDSITQPVWMYHEDDAHFGSLLMQVKEDNVEPSYDSSEGNIRQLSFSTSWPTRLKIDHAGVLNFAINDISLIESVRKKIEKEPILRDSLGLRNSLDSLMAKGDTIRDIWYNDNVGEVYLNITVLRAQIPSNIPMWGWVVKLYRRMELAFLTNTVSPSMIGTSYYIIGGRHLGGLLFIHILILALVVVLILYVDHKVLSHKTGFFSSEPTPPSQPTPPKRPKRYRKTKPKK